jgi:hypothetical protein
MLPNNSFKPKPLRTRLNSGVSRLMQRIAICVLIVASSAVLGGESPVVDTRLARAIEAAALQTGIDINIRQSDGNSVNINRLNGRNVCDKAAIEDVRKFQDAVAQQASVKNDFGPAYYSTLAPDGTRKVLTPEQLTKLGLLEGCTDIYVSVVPK